MKKLILAVILLAVVIYFGYPYLEQLGHPEDAVPGLSEMLEAANEKIHVTVDGAKDLYVQGQKLKELMDIASWKEIEKPEDAQAPIYTLKLGDSYSAAIYSGCVGITDSDGEETFYSMNPDAFGKLKAFFAEDSDRNE